jgi:hypothetical protein
MNYREERTFVVRFSLAAEFPVGYAGASGDGGWADAWRDHIAPRIVRTALAEIRAEDGWRAQVTDGGAQTAHDGGEIHIAVEFTPQDGGGASVA